MTSQHT